MLISYLLPFLNWGEWIIEREEKYHLIGKQTKPLKIHQMKYFLWNFFVRTELCSDLTFLRFPNEGFFNGL